MALVSTCKKVEKEMLVSTGTTTEILINSAIVSGNILDLGEGASQYGHCYGKTPGVTVFMSKTEKGIPSVVGEYSSTLSNLEAGTKYYVKAYISSAFSTVYGNEINFTTGAASLPTVTTTAPTAVTMNSASTGGNVTSDGGAAITAKGVCYSTTAVPTISGNKTDGGTGTGSFISLLSGLNPGTTYYIRAYASNAAGTSYGNELNFTTLQEASVATLAATSVSNNSATLNGTVNANNNSTVVSFEYGTTTGYGLSVTASQSPVTGSSLVSVSADLTGLTMGFTYHFRIKGVSAAGTVYGSDMTFTTQQLANVSTNSATSVTGNSAVLNGVVNANNVSAIVTFEYGTSTAYGTNITAFQSPVTGNSPTSVFATVTGLAAGTVYHFRVKAVNTNGTTTGDDYTFTTLVPPVATTLTATSVSTTSSTMNGSVNPNSNQTTVTFDYGTSPSYGSEVTASQSPLSGSGATSVSASLGGLLQGTLYYYRVKAVSIGGTAYGDQLTFTTLLPPTAITGAASSLTGTSAVLNGTVNANSLSTTVMFDYGSNTGYGNSVAAAQSPVSGSSNSAVTYSLTGLSASSTYHYRVRATSSAGTTYGDDVPFNTLQFPTATANPASSLGFTTATLNGTVNANGYSSTVTFEYGLTIGYGGSIASSPGTVTGSAVTPVSSAVTGLVAGSTYHYRVKAVSAAGTTYSGDMTFTLIPTTVIDFDGNVYNIVIIGDQAWFKQNLKTTHYNNGVSIPNVTSGTTWYTLTSGAWCNYDNSTANGTTYGHLYNWFALIDNSKLCPAGWHVATQPEVSQLGTYLGGIDVAGGKLKETGTTHWQTPNTGATNSSGFTALGAGHREGNDGHFTSILQYSNWWTGSDEGGNYAIAWDTDYASATLNDNHGNIPKYMGLPVRCIKDN
jgi:uncharacterized protein (TIGR02145 family)